MTEIKIAEQTFHITFQYPADDKLVLDQQWLEENLELGSAEIVHCGVSEPVYLMPQEPWLKMFAGLADGSVPLTEEGIRSCFKSEDDE